MKISYTQIIVNNRRLKRRIKKNLRAERRCYHCNGAFRGSDEIETCLMCGREKGHLCSNCMHPPENSLNEKKLA